MALTREEERSIAKMAEQWAGQFNGDAPGIKRARNLVTIHYNYPDINREQRTHCMEGMGLPLPVAITAHPDDHAFYFFWISLGKILAAMAA
jgi:hypothetical protein